MVSVRKLKKLADCIGMKYDKLNKGIAETRKGKVASIRNPRFPINLNTPEVGAILGFICSDGWIYIDNKARGMFYSSM